MFAEEIEALKNGQQCIESNILGRITLSRSNEDFLGFYPEHDQGIDWMPLSEGSEKYYRLDCRTKSPMQNSFISFSFQPEALNDEDRLNDILLTLKAEREDAEVRHKIEQMDKERLIDRLLSLEYLLNALSNNDDFSDEMKKMFRRNMISVTHEEEATITISSF